MTRSAYCLLSLLLVAQLSYTQNLLPNPSFEDTAVKVTPLYLPSQWMSAVQEGWDYYSPLNDSISADWSAPNNLFGFQVAKHGQSYVGIKVFDLYDTSISKGREYLQCELKNPLIQDSTYCLQLYTSLVDSASHASKSHMGIYLSFNRVSGSNNQLLPYTPQIILSPDSHISSKLEWVRVNQTYTASGGEKYFTMGNFKNNDFLDTVSIEGGGNQFWMKTAYYYYYDDFYLGPCDSLPQDTSIGLLERKMAFKEAIVYPNPSTSQFNIEVNEADTYTLEVMDHAGRSVFTNSFNGSTTQLNLAGLSEGIYFLRIISDQRAYYQKLILQE